MTHEILEAPGLRADLAARLRQLKLRAARIFSLDDAAGGSVAVMADIYHGLLVSGPETAVPTASLLQQDLIDHAELITPAFWTGPLGRALGYWTGGHERQLDERGTFGVPQVEAAAILKMSRQGVNDAIKRKRLTPVAAGVTALSVADYMHARYPLAVAA